MDQKIKYGKPVAMQLGPVSSIVGVSDCRGGTRPSGGCVGGSDPQTAPVCQPGLTATYNCGAGTTNLSGNCREFGNTASGCSTGSDPYHAKAE